MRNALRLAFVAAAISALGACGGGGSDDPAAPPPAPAPAPTTTPVSVKVIDGVLQSALVCLDANDNGACDSGEPQGRTGADGQVTLEVPSADVGKYSVLALVGTDAVDADSGPVTQAYTLKAPADRAALVSPWTTLVEATRQSSGVTTEQAEATVQSQTGLPVSPLADYSTDRATNAAHATASRAARILVAALQQQLRDLLPLAGQPDAGGATMSQADILATALARWEAMMGTSVQSSIEPAAAAACADPAGSACNASIAAAAQTAADGAQLSAVTLPAQAQTNRLQAQANQATGAGQPTARGMLLDWLTYTNANNWYYRAVVVSQAGAVPDATGLTRYRDERRSNVNGTVSSFAWVSDPARQGDLHWSGSAWVSCADGEEAGTNTARDARGVVARSNYCKGLNVSSHQRVPEGIAGKRMADVIARIRGNRPGASTWGPAPATVGDATFPAGAQLIHQTTTDTANAIAYDVRSSNQVQVYPQEVSAGGDARTGTPACSMADRLVFQNVLTLENLVRALPGTPCIYPVASFAVDGVQVTSPDPNEWWGNSTVSMGQIGNAPVNAVPRTAYLNTNRPLRVAFPGGAGSTAANYYQCSQLWVSTSTRNCKLVGTGNYTITTLGDARAMTFSNLPPEFAGITYEPLFVERGGQVYYGFRTRERNQYLMRLNDVAGAALMARLGMPAVVVP